MPRRLRKVVKPTNNTTHTTKATRCSLNGRPSGPMAWCVRPGASASTTFWMLIPIVSVIYGAISIQKVVDADRTIDHAHDGDHKVVEEHAPASDEAALRMQPAPNIRVSGPGGWIKPGP